MNEDLELIKYTSKKGSEALYNLLNVWCILNARMDKEKPISELLEAIEMVDGEVKLCDWFGGYL